MANLGNAPESVNPEKSSAQGAIHFRADFEAGMAINFDERDLFGPKHINLYFDSRFQRSVHASFESLGGCPKLS